MSQRVTQLLPQRDHDSNENTGSKRFSSERGELRRRGRYCEMLV